MEATPDPGNANLIARVLKLRRRMGINDGLSLDDPRDVLFFPSGTETSECSIPVPSVHDCRWLGWEQTPGEPPDGD